jgi:hypothetical protein
MGSINICNSAGRDAVVGTESVGNRLMVRWLDGKGRQAHPVRILKSTVDRDLDALMEQVGGLTKVSQALIEGDPEVNTEMVGSLLKETSFTKSSCSKSSATLTEANENDGLESFNRQT